MLPRALDFLFDDRTRLDSCDDDWRGETETDEFVD
jgi:hypothetical protein